MNQGGLKHAATDSRLDSKRERRRGASGRAAALRRAPSDSDCSGETASLSADSGDRAVRPPPPPTRAAKSRSRRRGSEWEVLEGLKDGQRFEKRPDVFNGYLHKKRKWPLKGWHKRFFVVDGGILVYARSPTDVARGRLHGSVDVGLSVISAKARRRRIDIDADEFIYHLRAKTPDVFRTWLNVLKAHRLYRQHLLTFGARESVPKIHAPLEDLPPTDTSSHASHTSFETSIETSFEDFQISPDLLSNKSIQHNNPKSPFLDWQFLNKEKLILFNFSKTNNAIEMVNNVLQNRNRSLCSMNCMTRLNTNVEHNKKEFDTSQGSTTTEKQVHITDLESNSLQITSRRKSDRVKNVGIPDKVSHKDNKVEPTFYFFARKKKDSSLTSVESPMKKSKKSTNLVKYRNVNNEPKLTEPISKCLLLKNYRFSKHETVKREHKDVECDSIAKENNEVQATIDNKEHKSLQDIMSTAEYDQITEKIMISLFEKHIMVHDVKFKEIEYYIGQVVRELYDVKFSNTDIHPVKMLFRSLLEYWLKNTSEEPFNRALKRVKSVGKPSNNHFTRDKILSSFLIDNATKQTQFHGARDFSPDYDVTNVKDKKQKPLKGLGRHKNDKKTLRRHSPKRDTESFEKERRIQELEKILKNTVYVCETVRSIQSKEKDIMITRKLLDNLDKLSKRSTSGNDDRLEHSQSSSEIPKIQETINNLISDNAIPAGVAKGFLNAYLEILLDGSKSMTNSSSQSSDQLSSKIDEPLCDVLTESVQKRISRSMVTANLEANNNVNYIKQERRDKDPGELYLQDVLDKIPHGDSNDNSKGDKTDKIGKCINEFPGKNLIHKHPKDNSVVIDLAKYELEHIYMHSDPTIQGAMSITIKLKEKPSHFGESKTQQLSLKFCNDNMKVNHCYSEDDWLNNFDSESFKKIFEPIDLNLKSNFDFGTPKDVMDVKPYSSSSVEASKCFCKIVHESEHSIDLSFHSSNYFKKEYSDNEDTQSCFIVSSFKKNTVSKLPSKKVHLRYGHGIVDKSTNIWSPGSSRYPVEYTMFEEPAPRIIDEKFILLLLENLTLLSKNIPSLYKDINGLYVKLKKKHEKIVRNSSNIQGLSLLGKIYNEDYKPNDQGTQYEDCECHNNFYKFLTLQKDVAVATHRSMSKKGFTDRAVSTCNMLPGTTVEAQTQVFPFDKKRLFLDFKSYGGKENYVKEYTCMNQAIPSDNVETEPNTFTNQASDKIESDPPLVKGTSVQKWVEPLPTKECAISTIIRTVLDTDRNFRMARYKNLENINVVRVDKEFLSGKKNIDNRDNYKKTDKASTKSQTEAAINNLNVYLFSVSKNDLKMSQSMINTALSNKSDDLKTLYRCNSEPSDCSGLISPTSPPLRGPQAGFVSGTPGGRLASWIIESGGPLESASRELGQAQLSVQQLQRLLEALELQHQTHHDTDIKLLPSVEVDVLL